MGLDMTVYRYKPRDRGDYADNGVASREVAFMFPRDAEELFYWRKHPNLHGWMESLWIRKCRSTFADDPELLENILNEDFNGLPVRLTLADLDDLDAVLRNDALPYTQGFFFGESARNEEQMVRDLEFVFKARDAIAQGYCVFYTSSW